MIGDERNVTEKECDTLENLFVNNENGFGRTRLEVLYRTSFNPNKLSDI